MSTTDSLDLAKDLISNFHVDHIRMIIFVYTGLNEIIIISLLTFWRRILLCSVWPWTQHVVQAGILLMMILPTLTSWVFDMCYHAQLTTVTMPNNQLYYWNMFNRGWNLLCSRAWPWISSPSASVSQVPGLQIWITMPNFILPFLIWQFQIINVACYILLLDSTAFKIEICSVCSKWF